MKLRIHPTLAHPVAAALTVAAVQLLVLAAATLFLLTSCADGADSTDDLLSPTVPVPLEICSVSTDDSAAPATRYSETLKSGSIGIFRSSDGPTGVYPKECNNFQYNYSADGWKPQDAANTIYLMGTDIEVCAYYPFKAEYTDKTAIPIASRGIGLGNVSDVGDYDICYQSEVYANATTKRSKIFWMRHALTRLIFHLYMDAGGNDKLYISKLIFRHPALISSAMFNITNGTWANPVVTGSFTALDSKLYLSDLRHYTLLVPFDVGGADLQIDFTRAYEDGSSKDFTVTVPAALLGDRLKAGYSYDVCIAADNMSVDKVKVTPWTEKDINGDGGNPFPI